MEKVMAGRLTSGEFFSFLQYKKFKQDNCQRAGSDHKTLDEKQSSPQVAYMKCNQNIKENFHSVCHLQEPWLYRGRDADHQTSMVGIRTNGSLV